MSDKEQYPERVYVKGDRSVVAKSAATAVALEFDGYSLVDDAKAESAEDKVNTSEEKPAADGPKPRAPRWANPDAPVTDNRDSGTDPAANIPPA